MPVCNALVDAITLAESVFITTGTRIYVYELVLPFINLPVFLGCLLAIFRE